MFKLAELFVDIKANQEPFERALTGVRGQLTSTTVAIGTFVGNIASMMARAALGFAGGLFDSTIKSASSLNETISKTKVTFGEATNVVVSQADEMAKSFGLPKQAILDAASIFGLFAEGAGQSKGKAAEFSNQMVKLAADAMSFYNVPFEVALEKIRSGLAGEVEPLRAFGVFLSEASVKAEAASLGLGKVGQELTDGEKVTARASLIMKGLSQATGDLERTSSGTENKMRSFWGVLENLGTNIGEVVLPAFDDLLSVGVRVLVGLSSWFDANKESISGWVNVIRDKFAIVVGAFSHITEISASVSAGVGAAMSNVVASVSAVGQNIVNIAGWIGKNWYNLIVDAVNASITAFQNFGAYLMDLGRSMTEFLSDPSKGFRAPEWKPLLEGFKATTDALPDLIVPKLRDPFAAAFAEGIRSALPKVEETIKGGEGVGAMMRDVMTRQTRLLNTEAARGAGAEREKKTEIMGVADFAEKLRLAQYDNDTAKKQLKASEETAKNTRDMAEKGMNQVAIVG